MIKKNFLAFALATFFIVFGTLPASAATKYVVNIVEETFSTSTEFLAPGDINGNGTVDAVDLSLLKKQLLGIDEYNDSSDVNGDFSVNILDLVRQRKNSASEQEFFTEGKINLNGKSVIKGNQLSNVGPGATYRIKCSSTATIKVVISGVWGQDKIIEFSPDKEIQEITMPKTISDPSNAKIALIGTGTVTEVKFTRINMDNELSANSIK